MRRMLAVLLLVPLVGCGSRSPERDDVVAEVAELVVAGDTLDDDTRRCVAERLVDQLGTDAAADLEDAARKRFVSVELRTVVAAAFDACDALGPLVVADR